MVMCIGNAAVFVERSDTSPPLRFVAASTKAVVASPKIRRQSPGVKNGFQISRLLKTTYSIATFVRLGSGHWISNLLGSSFSKWFSRIAPIVVLVLAAIQTINCSVMVLIESIAVGVIQLTTAYRAVSFVT
jgi:hypothetical protein